MKVKRMRSSGRNNMEEAPNSSTKLWQLRQKVGELETNLADSAQQHGQEISDLQSQLAKLLSQLERSEALRLDAEYQLVVSQQEAVRLRETLEERNSELQSSKSTSQNLIIKLSKQCQEWQGTLEAVQQERAKNHELLTIKEQQMASRCHDYEELERAAAMMTADLIKQQSLVAEKEARVIELEGKVKELMEVVASQSLQIEATTGKEASQQAHLHNALKKLRTLEEQLKEDRAAAHCLLKEMQESLRETQDSLRLERLSKQQTEEALKEAKSRTNYLKHLLDSQAQKLQITEGNLQSAQEDLHRAEQEHVLKMGEKDSMIEGLSHQLQICKTSLDSLKQEVSEAKQRQAQAAECYGGFVQQLREEVHLFCVGTLKHTGSYPTTPTPTPEEVVKALGSILKDFQKQHEANMLQLKALKEKKSTLTFEYTKCQDNLKSNTLAKEELKARLHQSTRDLARTRSELGKATSQVCEQRSSLERLQIALDKRGEMLKKIKEEHAALKKQDGCRQQTYLKFLDTLHAALKGIKATPPAASSPPPNREAEDHAWSRRSHEVLTMTRCVGEELKATRAELAHVRALLEREKASGLGAWSAHRDLESKFLRQLEDQEKAWKEKLAHVSSEYAPALRTLSKQMEKQEHATSDALQHAQELLRDNQSLMESLEQSQTVHGGCAARHFCLLAATTLLSGALVPALHRVHALSTQRQLICRELAGLHMLRTRVAHLATLVRAELGSSTDSRELESCMVCGHHVLLKFRKAAIAVLAVNRLVLLGRDSLVAFVVTRDSRFNGSIAVHTPCDSAKLGTEERGLEHLQWLQSEGVVTNVCGSLERLQAPLSASKLPHSDSPMLLVKASFCSLLQGLLPHFGCDEAMVAVPVAQSQSLCTLLGRGLASVLAKRGSHCGCGSSYVTCLELADSLSIRITDLIGLFRDCAAKLHNIQQTLHQRDKECETFAKVCRNVVKMEDCVEHLKRDMVPREEYEVVCRERGDVIKSRENLETSLDSLSRDLQQVQARCESLVEALNSRDLALTEAAKDLSDVRMAMKHREHQTKLVEAQLLSCESEKQLKARQLEEMMEAVQKLTSERELTYQVMFSAETAFKKSRQSLSKVIADTTHDFGKEIVQAVDSFAQERIVTSSGHGVSRCELMLKAFVEAHQCALSCMSVLNEQLATSKGHIEVLKGELSAACLRECDGHIGASKVTPPCPA